MIRHTKMESTMVWKKEWDMGVSDDELIALCVEVINAWNHDQSEEKKSKKEPLNVIEEEEATFEALLEEVLDL